MKTTLATILAAAALAGAPLTARAAPVAIDKSGTVTITDIGVPLSSYMSAEARRAFLETAQQAPDPAWLDMDSPIAKLRTLDEAELKPKVDRMMARYAVRVQPRRIGGVPTRIVTPRGGVAPGKAKRVLISLHGGGFFVGAGNQALLEAVPVASVGGYEVVAVDYRQGPENRYPAASQDVTAVYTELLKTHAPADIGIFGCSAGGSLAAMALASFQKDGLPRPGALGLFGSSAFAGFLAYPQAPGAWGGDSRFTGPVLVGEPPQPIEDGPIPFPKAALVYLQGVDLTGPLVSPAMHPDVLAKFPPTLVITGSRSFEMSSAIQTHRELVKAGVDARLNVWDGMGHCFFADTELPESREAVAVITRFFDSHLGR